MATDDWFAQQGAPVGMPGLDTLTGGGSGFLAGDSPVLGITDPGYANRDWGQIGQILQQAQQGGADTSWWNPQDPQGSVQRLLAGKPPTSQTLLSLKPQFDAVGIQISPANAEGITSKINIPGVGWTRVLNQAQADPTVGGRGTGWVSVVQPDGGGGGGAAGGGFGGAGGGAYGNLTSGLNMGGYQVPGAEALGSGAGLWNPNDPTGQSSLMNLAASTFQQTPGYQARLNEGLQALQRSAAAKGTLLTGGTGKALERYGQDYAANEFQNQYQRLLGEQQGGYQQRLGAADLGLRGQGQYAGQLYNLANLGQGAAQYGAGLGAQYSGQAGQLLNNQATLGVDLTTGAGNAAAGGTIGAGNANAAGTQAGANAWGNALNAGTNAAQMYYLNSLMNRR